MANALDWHIQTHNAMYLLELDQETWEITAVHHLKFEVYLKQAHTLTHFIICTLNKVSFSFISSPIPLFMHLISKLTILWVNNTKHIAIYDKRTGERK